MKEAQVNRLRELEKRMTPGPWVVTEGFEGSGKIRLSHNIVITCNNRDVLEYICLARELAGILEVRHASKQRPSPPLA
jgi:hypothetical protein